ncbi:unnamed protein product [Gongylonema pulchrum]|uniref:AH domain-containing protein n=1 Tax=Gongylonema pulchrum TaxID=637853 RepID=A0A183CW23_9BILA|nr:unnamed protein product [Gongylonema pulchrum]
MKAFGLQIGIQLTRLKEFTSDKITEKSRNRNTLTQFFLVRSRSQQQAVTRKQELKYAGEEAAFQTALKKSCEDVRKKYPTAEIMRELAVYFSLLTKNGDLSDVVSQLRFLDRELSERSFEWILAVSALKATIDRICKTLYGFTLFA